MDTRSHNVLVDAAGFLYASLGFSLSVLAALFSIFQRPSSPSKVSSPTPLLSTKPNLPSNVRGRRIVRSFSDQSLNTPTPGRSSPAKLREPSSEKRKMISSHRRSRSLIPIITIDHFDTIESRISGPVNPLPKPYHFTVGPEDSAPSTESSTRGISVGVGDRPAFRLFSLKSWGKDRPGVERRSSSPQLFQSPLVPPTGSPVPYEQSDNEEKSKARSSSKAEIKIKPYKTLRKATSSRNFREKVNVKEDLPPPLPRSIEKKRAQTLRTQPYEAPYFCTPPMPMPIRKSPSRPELRSSPSLPSPSLNRKSSTPLIPNS